LLFLLWQTEEEFLADLTGQASDEDQEEEEEEEEEDFSESDEEEIEVQRKSEASANGAPKRKSLGSAVGKVPNVGAMLRALQHEGEKFCLNSDFIEGRAARLIEFSSSSRYEHAR